MVILTKFTVKQAFGAAVQNVFVRWSNEMVTAQMACILTGALAVFTAGVFVMWRFFVVLRRSALDNSLKISPAFTPLTSYNVVVLAPLPNESALDLVKGLKEGFLLNGRADYTVTLSSGENDRVKLFERANKALEKADVIVALGVHASTLAFEAVHQRHSQTPIYTTGVSEERLPLVKKHAAHRPLYGVLSQPDYASQCKTLRALKPTLKTLLILGSEKTPDKDFMRASSTAVRYDIIPITHRLSSLSLIPQQLSALSQNFDTILTLGHFTAASIEGLALYCDTHAITLSAQGADAVSLGAAIGFGGEYIHIGAHAARSISALLEWNASTENALKTALAEQYVTYINHEALSRQKTTLSPHCQYLLDTHQKHLQSSNRQVPVA